MADRQRILIVDDDPNTRNIVREVLDAEGYDVFECADGRLALDTFREVKPDLILLDVLMPGLDGISICLAIREESDVPLIFLSAKEHPSDKAIGLRIGADDYIGKPFDLDEFAARVRALLRRHQRRMSASPGIETAERMEFPGLIIDMQRHDVLVNGVPVGLTPIEFKLLARMASEPNRLFTRDQLMQDVWDHDFSGQTRTIDVHIRRLRKKIDDVHGPAHYIITVRGFGYRFTLPAATMVEH
jgi:DNA-binding response OmpR family regulator